VPNRATDLDRDFYQNIGYLIRRSHQIGDALFDRDMRHLRLTPVQFGILLVVSAYAGIDQYQLGCAIGFDRTTISYVVRKLVAKNLIRKFKEDSDRRSNLLVLTEHGQAVLAEARPIASKTADTFQAELTLEERQTLSVLLNKIVNAHDAQGAKPRISFSRQQLGTTADALP